MNRIYLIKEVFIYYYIELCVNSFVFIKLSLLKLMILQYTEKIF